MWILFLEMFPIHRIEEKYLEIGERCYVFFLFHGSQAGTVVIVMPFVPSQLSHWKRSVLIKSTRRHIWLLTELDLFGSFLLALTLCHHQISDTLRFEELLVSGSLFCFFHGCMRFGWLIWPPCVFVTPTPTWGEKAVGFDGSIQMAGCWGSGFSLGICRPVRRQKQGPDIS